MHSGDILKVDTGSPVKVRLPRFSPSAMLGAQHRKARQKLQGGKNAMRLDTFDWSILTIGRPR